MRMVIRSSNTLRRIELSGTPARGGKRQRATALHDGGAIFESASSSRRFWSAAALCRFLVPRRHILQLAVAPEEHSDIARNVSIWFAKFMRTTKQLLRF